MRAYQGEDYQTAIREFEAAYQIERQPRLLLNIGNARFMAGDLDGALRYYDLCEHQPVVDEQTAAGLRAGREAIWRIRHPAPQPRRPVYRQPWFWSLLGGVAASGLAVGLGLGLGPDPLRCGEAVPCFPVDLRQPALGGAR